MRQFTGSDSMLMQLPTPEDCISSTARCPPSQAPAASAMPSSSVVSTTARMSGIGVRRLDQVRVAGVGDIGELCDARRLQRGVDLRLPGR